ncbi:hypothetical protein GCM10023116_51300 [Kistimonas scapharcae]|uniref:DUF5666 domain-containing protein n=1 Tax=Kistimonas scapharcae TaxID=1036133 RepID=A0ABP8VAU3_9GAMM
MPDLTGYSYSRGEIASKAWVDTGTVVAVEVVGRTAGSWVEDDAGDTTDAIVDSRHVLMTIQLDTGAHISIEQAVGLDEPIHKGDRVNLVSEGGVTRVVTAVPLMNQ